ncbi:RNA 2',3'-cyclic phosphodiesterase [Beggiatoa leptomitoformis]|uniref:RNA 2',3'-cyclic phosphodiesterase n=1 Tax=Beggiatoa leptomitoformis TaxID=288004 RepID=A0A2N9YFT8_9GAMM|nr:RNA 2',3'-cyclic phosphodiesterase [Beggiatoa leptomitoformis]ALG68322.1 RNA 2',3'-cyclic phosphodiesterase [Beggiatoa leptomitoformis]AUI69362.1 RNA 2',3'-cyclic phosphodiesterase [Beggiatoa leptomitoformis]
MPDTPKERLFFALFPPPEIRDQIVKLTRPLIQPNTGIELQATDLHITLIFIGETETQHKSCITQIADGIRATPFTLTLETLGYWEKPRILWLAPQPSPDLHQLVNQLTQQLSTCGYQAELRPYQAHISLLRKASPLTTYPPIPPLAWTVDAFCLARSIPHSQENRYEIIQRWLF